MAEKVAPVDELRDVALRLRKLVADLPADAKVPWRQVFTDSEYMDGVAICADHQLDEHDACDNCWTIETFREGLAAYLVSMHPDALLALADHLESVVRIWSQVYNLHTDSPASFCPSCYRAGDVSDTDLPGRLAPWVSKTSRRGDSAMGDGLYPTPTRLALLRDVDGRDVFWVSQRSGSYARNQETGRRVTADIREVERAGWVRLGGPDAAGFPLYELTNEGRRILAEYGGQR